MLNLLKKEITKRVKTEHQFSSRAYSVLNNAANGKSVSQNGLNKPEIIEIVFTMMAACELKPQQSLNELKQYNRTDLQNLLRQYTALLTKIKRVELLLLDGPSTVSVFQSTTGPKKCFILFGEVHDVVCDTSKFVAKKLSILQHLSHIFEHHNHVMWDFFIEQPTYSKRKQRKYCHLKVPGYDETMRDLETQFCSYSTLVCKQRLKHANLRYHPVDARVKRRGQYKYKSLFGFIYATFVYDQRNDFTYKQCENMFFKFVRKLIRCREGVFDDKPGFQKYKILFQPVEKMFDTIMMDKKLKEQYETASDNVRRKLKSYFTLKIIKRYYEYQIHLIQDLSFLEIENYKTQALEIAKFPKTVKQCVSALKNMGQGLAEFEGLFMDIYAFSSIFGQVKDCAQQLVTPRYVVYYAGSEHTEWLSEYLVQYEHCSRIFHDPFRFEGCTLFNVKTFNKKLSQAINT